MVIQLWCRRSEDHDSAPAALLGRLFYAREPGGKLRGQNDALFLGQDNKNKNREAIE